MRIKPTKLAAVALASIVIGGILGLFESKLFACLLLLGGLAGGVLGGLIYALWTAE